MDFFKEWCFSVCIALIISVIFSLLTPKGSMSGFYKTMISFFILISFIYPLKDFNISSYELDFESSTFEINNELTSGYENSLNTAVKNTLKISGITGCNVDSSVKLNSHDNEIEIQSVDIFIPNEYSKQAVESLIFEQLGINSRVVYVGE